VFGNVLDLAWCHLRHSKAVVEPSVVGAYAEDVSVYGVCDLSGGVSEYTSTPYASAHGQQRPGQVVVRGGSWVGGKFSARAAEVGLASERVRREHYGFRMVRSIGPKAAV
jgi:formylglycine-generating enzyme required for sulfatase activity